MVRVPKESIHGGQACPPPLHPRRVPSCWEGFLCLCAPTEPPPPWEIPPGWKSYAGKLRYRHSWGGFSRDFLVFNPMSPESSLGWAGMSLSPSPAAPPCS